VDDSEPSSPELGSALEAIGSEIGRGTGATRLVGACCTVKLEMLGYPVERIIDGSDPFAVLAEPLPSPTIDRGLRLLEAIDQLDRQWHQPYPRAVDISTVEQVLDALVEWCGWSAETWVAIAQEARGIRYQLVDPLTIARLIVATTCDERRAP
jgi:hypothetical protein